MSPIEKKNEQKRKMENRCNFNEVFFVIFLFVTMVGLSTILLFAVPWIYRMVKRCYQATFTNHTRLQEKVENFKIL